MRFPILQFGILAVSLIGILLLRRASLEGKIILVFAALALSAFVRLNFYLLLFTALALFAFVAVAVAWGMIASTGLNVGREIKSEALAGETIRVDYRISTKTFLPLYHVRIWDKAFRLRADRSFEEREFSDPGYLSFLRLRPGEACEGFQHFVPPVRGFYRLGPVAIEGGDPFGIFSFIRWLPEVDECLVLPSWVRLAQVPSIPARLGAREQEHLVTREGHSHEFLGTREWTDGDSLRRVHWPLSARHDKLIVRQFQREVEEEMLVILDADAVADVGDGPENALEYLITMSLSLIHAANDLGRPWIFIIAADKTITIKHSDKEALLAVQYTLARLEAKRDEPIENQLETIRAQHRSAAVILLTARTEPEPAFALAHGDSQAGGELHSLIVRVDPRTFVTGADGSVKRLKRSRAASEAMKSGRETRDKAPDQRTVSPVPELTVTRGDNIAELFLSRALA
jgi:uncharacterized protein (DUF58 family)